LSNKSESPQVGISFPTTALEFVDKACEVAGKSRSAFLRDAGVALAAQVLGTEAPVVEVSQGRKSPLAAAAAGVGLDVKTYQRQCAEMISGLRASGAFEAKAQAAE